MARRERHAFLQRIVETAEARAAIEELAAEHVAWVEQELGRDIRGSVDALNAIAGRVYGDLSASAHNQRRGFADSVSEPLQRMSYGRHPDPRARSRWIEFGESLIEQTCLDVGTALAEVVGIDNVKGAVLALVSQLHVVRDTNPFAF